MPKPTIPAGIATRRSRRGCVITSPRLRSGVPVSQLKTNGTNVSGSSRSSRSSRIHDQLLATVVCTTALVGVGLVGAIDGGDILGPGLGLPAEKDHVSRHDLSSLLDRRLLDRSPPGA